MISALVTDTENTMTALGKSLPMDHHYCAAHVWELTTVLQYFSRICTVHCTRTVYLMNYEVLNRIHNHHTISIRIIGFSFQWINRRLQESEISDRKFLVVESAC